MRTVSAPAANCRAASKIRSDYSATEVVPGGGCGATTQPNNVHLGEHLASPEEPGARSQLPAGPTNPSPVPLRQPGRRTNLAAAAAATRGSETGGGHRKRGGPGGGPGARGTGETGTYPRPAGGRSQPSPGGDEVGRRGSPAPADEGEQGPQEEGGRGAAQVQAEPEQDGARPRASGRLPATGPQPGEAHGGECGHGHWHSPAPAARSPRRRRVFPGVRPALARGAGVRAAAGGCGRREVEAGAAAVGGIGVHAAS